MLKQIKKVISYLPWYLLLAPQRQEGVLYTWLLELKGLSCLIRHGLCKKDLRPLSICTYIQDGSKQPFLQYILPAITDLQPPEFIELSVCCSGKDSVQLESDIRKLWPGKLILTFCENLSRPAALNKAVRQAFGPLVFILAEKWEVASLRTPPPTASGVWQSPAKKAHLPPNLLTLCNRYITPKTAWFPANYHLKAFASTKAQFEKAGGYKEDMLLKDHEDRELWLRFIRSGVMPLNFSLGK